MCEFSAFMVPVIAYPEVLTSSVFFFRQIGNVQPLLDMMALTLEKLPSGTFSRATIGSSMILAHMISLALASSCAQQVRVVHLLVALQVFTCNLLNLKILFHLFIIYGWYMMGRTALSFTCL